MFEPSFGGERSDHQIDQRRRVAQERATPPIRIPKAARRGFLNSRIPITAARAAAKTARPGNFRHARHANITQNKRKKNSSGRARRITTYSLLLQTSQGK